MALWLQWSIVSHTSLMSLINFPPPNSTHVFSVPFVHFQLFQTVLLFLKNFLFMFSASLEFWDRNIFFFHSLRHPYSMAKLLQGWFGFFLVALSLFICDLPLMRWIFSFFIFCFFPLLRSLTLLYWFVLVPFCCAGRRGDLFCWCQLISVGLGRAQLCLFWYKSCCPAGKWL